MNEMREKVYLVEYAPERPDVRLEVVAVLIDALRRHVVGSAHQAERHARALAEEATQAEVAKLDGALGRDEHIGRLQVAMHDTAAVHVLQCARYLQEILPYGLLGYEAILFLEVLDEQTGYIWFF
jgi:hypothetical protein